MLVSELHRLPDERQPLLSGLVTLLAFIVAGSVPLVAYRGGIFVMTPDATFLISIALTAVALFALGAARVLVTERYWLCSGLEMLLVGGLAAGVA